jgi:hypothetical protein
MHLVEETSVALPRMTGVAGALQKAEQWLGSIIAAAAAFLVIAEIIVLFSGVSARYLFQKPIIWSDELAGILFLWLALLGAVTAFQRGEHMRMTAFVGMVSPRTRAFFDVLAVAAPLEQCSTKTTGKSLGIMTLGGSDVFTCSCLGRGRWKSHHEL